MRVLVTGAEGFVGGHLVRTLAERGDEVVAAHREGPPASAAEGVAWLPFDLTDAASVERLVEEAEPDAVAHLAGLSSVAASWEAPAATMETNAVGAVNLLSAVRRRTSAARPRTLLLIGSSEVYGVPQRPGEPFREDDPLRPLNPYGASKAAQEMAAWALGRVEGLRLVQTRSFTHTGPGQRPPFVLAEWTVHLLRIQAGLEPPELSVGDLRLARDITDVRDVVDAYVGLLDAGVGGCYNVCSGHASTLRELLTLLQEIVGVDIEPRVDPDKIRPADVPVVVGDRRKIGEAIGWAPKRPIRRTLEDLVEELRATTQPSLIAGRADRVQERTP